MNSAAPKFGEMAVTYYGSHIHGEEASPAKERDKSYVTDVDCHRKRTGKRMSRFDVKRQTFSLCLSRNPTMIMKCVSLYGTNHVVVVVVRRRRTERQTQSGRGSSAETLPMENNKKADATHDENGKYEKDEWWSDVFVAEHDVFLSS